MQGQPPSYARCRAAMLNTWRQPTRVSSRCAVNLFVMKKRRVPDSVRTGDQALGNPPQVAVPVPDAALPVPVRHVRDGHDLGRTGLAGTPHGFVGVLDVQVVRRRHGGKCGGRLANHDGRRAELDLGVGDPVPVHVAKDLGAAQAGDEKIDELGGTSDDKIRRDGIEPWRNVHVDSDRPAPVGLYIEFGARAALAA